jgi:hypothetical protein
MPKTAFIARHILAPIFLVAAVFALTGQTTGVSTASAGSVVKATAMHVDGLPCMSCGG